MRVLAAMLLYLASGLFIGAAVLIVRAKHRLRDYEKTALREARGRRGPIDLLLTLLTLALGFLGAAVYGLKAIPIVSLPLFAVVLVTELLDVIQLLRGNPELPADARRSLLLPSTIAFAGIGSWTAGCLIMLRS